MRGLYFVTDRGLCGNKPLEEVVIQAVKGGAAYVQLREKGVSTRFFLEEAKSIKKLLEQYRVPLIINDRVDVALACGAEGVHIGQEDMPYEMVRKLMGQKAIIGLSVETWEDGKPKNGCKLYRRQSGFFHSNQNGHERRMGFGGSCQNKSFQPSSFSRHRRD
jgi:thiamine-phosphate diphosphorylase